MDVKGFLRDGYLVVRGAFDAATAEACRNMIWQALADQGVSRGNRRSWDRPLVRINCPDGEPFTVAGTSPSLTAAYDLLLGEARWTRRDGVGGTIPVRFPSEEYPGEIGWHIEGNWWGGAGYWTNVQSRGRGLLALFLFSDVGPDDAPTRLVLGSHLFIPPILAPAGDAGMGGSDVAARLRPSVLCRRTVDATGRARGRVLVSPLHGAHGHLAPPRHHRPHDRAARYRGDQRVQPRRHGSLPGRPSDRQRPHPRGLSRPHVVRLGPAAPWRPARR